MEPLAVTFDIYGTLFDIETDEESDDIFRKFSHWLYLNEVKIDPDSLKHAYKQEFVKREALMLANGVDRPEVDVRDVLTSIFGVKGRRRFVEEACLIFRSLTTKRISLRNGVDLSLRSIGKPLALISNAQSAFTWPELRAFGIDQLFSAVVLSSEVRSKKPSPIPFRVALAELGMNGRESRIIHVGDTYETDVVGAKKVGMKAILITKERRGFEVKPDALLDPDRFGELPDVIRSIY